MMEECIPVSMLNDYQELLQSVRHVILSHKKQQKLDDGKIQWDAQLWLLKKSSFPFLLTMVLKLRIWHSCWAAANAQLKGD